MTTDSNNTDPPRHIFWLFIVHMLRALGPEKGRQVLADTTDLMREAGVWPLVLESFTDQLSEAYVYACGLKDCTQVSKKCLEDLKHAYAQDHILDMAVKAGDAPQQVLDEVEKLKREGYLEPEFRLIPLHIAPGQLKQELEKLGFEPDEFGATKGCDCPGCAHKRTKAKDIEERGYDPLEN